jgi:hypothetical protein
LFTDRIEAVVPERSPEEITAELEEKLTSLLGTPDHPGMYAVSAYGTDIDLV